VHDPHAVAQSYNAGYIPNSAEIALALLTQNTSACITYFDNFSFMSFQNSCVGNCISMFMMNSFC